MSISAQSIEAVEPPPYEITEEHIVVDTMVDKRVGGYTIYFYGYREHDEEDWIVSFAGEFWDMECDPFEVSGYSDEFDIHFKDYEYVKLGAFYLGLLQKFMDHCKKLERDLNRKRKRK